MARVEFSVNIKKTRKKILLSYLQLVEIFENGSVDSVEFVGVEVQLSQTHETLECVLIDADGAVGQVVARQVQQRKLRQACVEDKHKFGPINQVRAVCRKMSSGGAARHKRNV